MTEDELKEALEKAQADIAKLTEQNKTLIGEKRSATTKAQEAAEQAQRLADEQAEASGNLETVKASLEAKHQRELEKIQKAHDEAVAQRNTLMIDNVITADLATHNVAPQFRSLLTQAWKSQARVEDGVAQIDGQPISEFIASFAKSDEGAYYVQAPLTTGGGAQGSTNTEASEWTKESFNITKFSQLAKSDPARANAISESLGLPYRV